MKNVILALAMLSTLCFALSAVAQRQGRQDGPPPPPRRGANQQGVNQGVNNVDQDGNAIQPSAGQLAQMMMANFDADGSGELNQTELESALVALDQHMRSQGGGPPNQGRRRGDGELNEEGQAELGGQRQGNRPPPPPGQGRRGGQNRGG